MTALKAVERAQAELGDATPEKIAAFVQRKYGVYVPPMYIPYYQAIIEERLDEVRRKLTRIGQQAHQNRALLKAA